MSVAPTSNGDDGTGPPTEDPVTTSPRPTTTQQGPGVTATGTLPPQGYVSPDYAGSYQEWFETAVQILLERYSSGEGGSGWAEEGFQSPYGTPNPNDFGNNTISWQTENFVENFVREAGDSSNWILENIGPPPDRDATYIQDPNSASAIQQGQQDFTASENAKDREFTAEQNAADRAAAAERARISAEATKYSADVSAAASRYAADQATARTQMQIDNAWRIAKMDDATRRYIAEGDWGVQKWVTTENNRAAMARLERQIEFDEKALAQRAIEEKNRHREQMVGLAMEVAKYDAELAASPRNLMKYAAWLQNRNIVVNGMSLAMAAQEVPEDMIDPEEVAETTGDNLAAMQTAQETEALVSGQSGGMQQQLTPEELDQIVSGATATDITGQQQGAQQLASTFPGQEMLPQKQTSLSAEQLESMDPQAIANDLLGSNPLAPTQGDFSTQNLQSLMDATRTGGTDQAGFGAYSGPTTNALGVEIPEVSGKDVDFREFSDLLPTEQGVKLSGIESVRGPSGVNDFAEEMLRSRPKGRARGGSLSFG